MAFEAMAWPEQLHKFLQAISRSQLLYAADKILLLLPNLPKYGTKGNLSKHLIVLVACDDTHMEKFQDPVMLFLEKYFFFFSFLYFLYFSRESCQVLNL